MTHETAQAKMQNLYETLKSECRIQDDGTYHVTPDLMEIIIQGILKQRSQDEKIAALERELKQHKQWRVEEAKAAAEGDCRVCGYKT